MSRLESWLIVQLRQLLLLSCGFLVSDVAGGAGRSSEHSLPSLANHPNLLSLNILIPGFSKPLKTTVEDKNSPTRKVPPDHETLVDDEVGAVLCVLLLSTWSSSTPHCEIGSLQLKEGENYIEGWFALILFQIFFAQPEKSGARPIRPLCPCRSSPATFEFCICVSFSTTFLEIINYKKVFLGPRRPLSL